MFRDLFPIGDVNGKYSLEFVGYALGDPKYTVEECIERDMTYAAPLRTKLRLDVFEEVDGQRRLNNAIEKEVYLGELPIMTPLGTFVINGAERVVVSQLHRSPGVVFEEDTHPNGQRLFSARIIPFRGSWVEFTIDIHDVIYVHIDKKKKFPATALLRAFGYGHNADILRLFFAEKDLDITGRADSRQERREIVGAMLAGDVANPEDPKGDPLGKLGDELTPERLQAMRHVGVKNVRVLRRLFGARPAGRGSADVQPRPQQPRSRLRGRRSGNRRGAGRGRKGTDRQAAREAGEGRRPQDRRDAGGREGRIAADPQHAVEGSDPLRAGGAGADLCAAAPGRCARTSRPRASRSRSCSSTPSGTTSDAWAATRSTSACVSRSTRITRC